MKDEILIFLLGTIDLAYCNILYRDLKKGLEGLVLESLLHLIYLTTPYDMASCCDPDWMIYFRQVRIEGSSVWSVLFINDDAIFIK